MEVLTTQRCKTNEFCFRKITNKRSGGVSNFSEFLQMIEWSLELGHQIKIFKKE